MRSPLHLVRSIAFCVGAVVAGTALAAPASPAGTRSDCLEKARVQFSIDDLGCVIYPITSVPYSECKARAARAYQIAMANCALDKSLSSSRPQLRNPTPLTIKD